MVGINCLFNYDGINYRFNINSKSEKEVINFEELRKTLRDHPKLKEVDFFDTEKYVVEIFDKGFDDYVKLPRDADICDYSKLRARLRPKSTLKLVNTVEESKKRPLASMYSEINMEEEHAAKVLRGSPPPARMRGSSPPSYRRSHSGISETPRSEHLSRSHTSVKTPSLPSKPPTVHPSFNPKVTPKPSPVPRNQPPPPPPPPVVKTPAPVKTPVVSETPDTPRNPFSSSFSSSKSEISNTPRTSGFHDNGRSMDSYPSGVNQDSILLAKAVEKYNDEFINIMMFDEIWETDHVWPFVFREISGHGVKNIQNMKEARTAFKSLVDKYIEILQKTNLTETAANELWPMFGIFANLNMKPFYGRIQILKDAFNKGIKDSGDKPPTSSSTSPPLLPTTSTTTTTQQPSLSQTTTASLSASRQPQQQQEAPKPQRIQTKEPPEDFIRLSCDETDQSDVRMEEDDDDIQEVHPNTSPPQPPQQTSPPALSTSTSPPLPKPATGPQPIVVTSDDFRLLLAVEDHNKEFYDDVVSEYSVWRDVTDQINLFQPFEPSLVTKYKTRFYELLKEFTRIESSSMPVSEKASWKLYSSFINIDIAPFLSKL